MGIAEQKNNIRKSMLNERNALPAEIKTNFDRSLLEQLQTLIVEHNVKIIHTYLPMNSEVDLFPLLHKLLEKNDVKIVCPKTLPKRLLENRILHSFTELEEGPMGTKHPKAGDIYKGPYDLIIVPGLAYDANKYRVGYGGGYYDRFLSEHPEALKVGLFYPFQELPEIPREAHDVRMDRVLVGDEGRKTE